MILLSRKRWARAAVSTAIVVAATSIPAAEFAAAQDQPAPVLLEQARSGEDGTSGAGATSGGFSTGNAKRDKNGNGGNASAGGAGETATATGDGGGGGGGGGEASEPLPENAELLDALGILDDVTAYDIDVLVGMDIPVELLPPPDEPAPEPAPTTDVNTGGQGGDGVNSSVSTEPGDGAAPAGGSTSSAAEDGTNNSGSGEKPRKKDREGASDTATTTDGATDTATATG